MPYDVGRFGRQQMATDMCSEHKTALQQGGDDSLMSIWFAGYIWEETEDQQLRSSLIPSELKMSLF